MASTSGGEEHFMDQHRADLIQRITMIPPVLDNLLQEGLLTQEQCDTVKAKKTPQEKMRGLYKFSRGWSIPDKEILYRALQASNPGVMEHLEGTSLSDNLRKKKKRKLKNRLSGLSKEHRASMKKKFLRIPEYNSRMGEAVHLKKRFTKLSMIKGHKNKEEKEEALRSSGRRHVQTMEKRPPTTIPALFDSDEEEPTPEIVVLQGAAGIGKTMTSMKIMLDWASEDLYRDKFDFVFYLSCREINTILGDISLVGLLSRSCRLSSGDLVSILEDPGSQRKLLIIVDGFDELKWTLEEGTLEEESEGCPDISMKTHKEIILQSLLRGQVLPESSLIITTRSLAMEKLKPFIADSRNVEIQGFTREDREEYVHNFYGNKEDADKVLRIIKEDDVVYTMCAVPITCWIVCTVMKQEMGKDLALIRCKTTTSIYLLFLEVLLTHHTKTHHSKKKQSVLRKQTCLKKLCALANRGLRNRQILFEKKDLKKHGLSLDEVESVFLNENIFHWDVRTQTCYSFIHLSVQEFLAALHYGIDDGSGSMKRTFFQEICKGQSLRDLSSDSSHLSLSVQFLFGLLNENQMKTFSEITGIPISLQVRRLMIKWAKKDIDQYITIQTIFCLYETQDEDFIRSVMSGCTSLELRGSHFGHSRMDKNYSKQLSYCLKTLKRGSFHSLDFQYLPVDSECQKNLSPYLHKSEKVRFGSCRISSKDCLGEDKVEEDDPFSSAYEMKSDSLSFLMNPESKIQELRLDRCGVTSSACDDLRSILINNRSLTSLDLLGNKLEDSGIKFLCEGLRDPHCTLQSLRLSGCNATSSGCDDLLRSIFINNRSLTSLDLSGNDVHDSGIKLLCEGLRNLGCSLQSLWLDKCGMTSSGCKDFRSILISNQSLTTLNLSHNCLGDSGIKLLSVGLRDPCCSLQYLSLEKCDVSSSGCKDLQSIFISNQSLTSLDLSDNNLGDSGIKRLCEGLKHPRCTLESLRVYDCRVPFSFCDDLCSFISANQTLTNLEITLDDEEIRFLEDDPDLEALQKAGFSVDTWFDVPEWRDPPCEIGWELSIQRNRLENGQLEVIFPRSSDLRDDDDDDDRDDDLWYISD